MNNENNFQLTEDRNENENAEKQTLEFKMIKKLIGYRDQDGIEHPAEIENLFVIVSKRTACPFVICDPETFDDEILVFEKPEDVQNALKRLSEEMNPVDVGVIYQNNRLNFFASFLTMGVNCVVLNSFTDHEEKIQLNHMVKTPKGKTPDGQPWIENPALYLTGIYFMQSIARNVKKEETAELTEMREEIVAHYSKGNFIVMVNEQGQLPIMRFPNGDAYQPVFTDMFEAAKFKLEQPFNIVAIHAMKIPAVLAKEAKGIVVNPNTICLQLPIIRQPLQPQQAPVQTEAPVPEKEQ